MRGCHTSHCCAQCCSRWRNVAAAIAAALCVAAAIAAALCVAAAIAAAPSVALHAS